MVVRPWDEIGSSGGWAGIDSLARALRDDVRKGIVRRARKTMARIKRELGTNVEFNWDTDGNDGPGRLLFVPEYCGIDPEIGVRWHHIIDMIYVVRLGNCCWHIIGDERPGNQQGFVATQWGGDGYVGGRNGDQELTLDEVLTQLKTMV